MFLRWRQTGGCALRNNCHSVLMPHTCKFIGHKETVKIRMTICWASSQDKLPAHPANNPLQHCVNVFLPSSLFFIIATWRKSMTFKVFIPCTNRQTSPRHILFCMFSSLSRSSDSYQNSKACQLQATHSTCHY